MRATLRAAADVVAILSALCRFTEVTDADAQIADAMATLHHMFWFPLKTDETIKIGFQNLPVMTVLQEALFTESGSRLASGFHEGEHGYDTGLNVTTDQVL